MIIGIDGNMIIKELNRANLPDHWGQYFAYEQDNELVELSREELLSAIGNAKHMAKPYIDSKIVIGAMLTKMGLKSKFHRQFNERYPELHKEQVLGMQLYKLIVEDLDKWIFHETHHSGHVFPNATYFQQVI